MIRILIADDQAIVRDGLKLMISLEADFQVVALADNGKQAIELAEQHTPDIILMDINMPIVDGVSATTKILSQYPTIKVLILTTYDTEDSLADALAAGACGYLLKDTTREDLIKAIRGTLEGKNFIDPQVVGYLLKEQAYSSNQPLPLGLSQLNERERNVLRLIGQGLPNSRISEKLYLSEGTVRNYVSSILTKLGVSDRTQAAIIAVKHGLDL